MSYQAFLVDVVRHGQHLQAAAVQRREEVVDVLAAHHVDDGVRLFAVRAALADAPPRSPISAW